MAAGKETRELLPPKLVEDQISRDQVGFHSGRVDLLLLELIVKLTKRVVKYIKSILYAINLIQLFCRYLKKMYFDLKVFN